MRKSFVTKGVLKTEEEIIFVIMNVTLGNVIMITVIVWKSGVKNVQMIVNKEIKEMLFAMQLVFV